MPETEVFKNLYNDELSGKKMTNIDHPWKLYLTEEQILKAEGADPALIQQRKPALYATASQALELGMPLVLPVLVSRTYQVISIQHQDILLEGIISVFAVRY